MKELKCKKCSCYLGEMLSGKIKKDAILLCTECYNKYKILEDMDMYNKGTKKIDTPDFLNDLLKGFKK